MTVLEVGPSAVRRLSPPGDLRLDGEVVAQALAGIDEGTVLIDERPVTVDSLWRHIFSSTVEEQSWPVIIVHPSWWPPRRVTRVVEAAKPVAVEVVAAPRSVMITGRRPGGATAVVEIADDVVAVCAADGSVWRTGRREDAAVIVSDLTEGPIVIDAPHGVHRGREVAADLRKALLRNGVSADIARIEEEVVLWDAEAAPGDPVRRYRPSALVVAAAMVGIVVCGVGVATTQPTQSISAPGAGSVGLVEGRVGVRIPAGWTVTRVTAGPGSRRVEIASPVDHRVVLHLTQSYAPEQTLDSTAGMLRRAVAKEQPGIFVDFDPADQRAGRAAVTYREVRADRDVRWSVVVDGDTRISIGCQGAPGDEDTIEAACEEAIRSAHETGGTPKAP